MAYMGTKRKASTIYLQPSVHKALKLKAVIRDCSLSDLAEEIIKNSLAEDIEDIKDVKKRKKESSTSLKDFVKMLKNENQL